MKCKNCGINKAIKYSKYSSGEFCSKKCACQFGTKYDTKKTKSAKCMYCGKSILINKRASIKKSCCDLCRKIYVYNICKVCGLKKSIHRKDVCKHYQSFDGLNKYFGMNLSGIGTTQIYKSYDDVVNKIKEMYYDRELSLLEIQKLSGHKNIRNLSKILKSIGIKLNSLSDSVRLSIKNGKSCPPTNDTYKHGWHTTWNNKNVFYRSSYELDYCNILDADKIDYDMESLRISYWDSQRNIYRIAIPDFHIKSKNLIVEIKSAYTYDEINMNDKISEYKKLNYNVELFIDKIKV